MKDIEPRQTSTYDDLEQIRVSDVRASTANSSADQLSIVDLWRVLEKRKWMVLGILAAVVLLVTAYSLTLPRRYDARSLLLLDLEGSEDLGLDQLVMPIGIDLDTKLQTQIRIVQSDAIANTVIEQLNLQNNPAFIGKEASSSARALASLDLQTRSGLRSRFQSL